MKKNEKIIIGVGVGILLLLWLRNRNNSEQVLKAGEGAGGTEDNGGSISQGGGGISPNALGGATPIIAPVIMTAPVSSPQPTLRPLPIRTNDRVSRIIPQKPLAPTKVDTSFAKFDGSFRSPSKLDFDGHIED